jgi:alginate O-acetyltransferase complex protein AlgI
MLFNSFEFIFALLPLSVVLYFLASRVSGRLAVLWLVLVSLFFYGWWRPENLPLFLASILFNFGAAALLSRPEVKWSRRTILIVGIAGNLGLLATFKYGQFIVANFNQLVGTSIPSPNFVLPLGISFFTFTQIAYLVDIYKARGTRHPFPTYALFVSYFPHLLAGPILHHAEMLPQFADDQNRKPRWDHLWQGICLFGIGLSKKVLLADALAPYARFGFDIAPHLNLLEAWLSSLAYFFQIYFDFSGYTDMALGVALLMNIRLPFNFDSPYRACDIQSFWRKWHITLGRFFRDYVYIPLGGNKLGGNRTLLNLFGVALLSGLWHGAAWSFVAWGAMHGTAMVVHALWKKRGRPLPSVVAWSLMFVFLNISWVLFRAPDTSRMREMLRGMSGANGVVLFSQLEPVFGFLRAAHIQFRPLAIVEVEKLLAYLAIAFVIAVLPWNSNRLAQAGAKIHPLLIATIALLATISILQLNQLSEFIYFNF